jgi:hypothetical protein
VLLPQFGQRYGLVNVGPNQQVFSANTTATIPSLRLRTAQGLDPVLVDHQLEALVGGMIFALNSYFICGFVKLALTISFIHMCDSDDRFIDGWAKKKFLS